MSSSINFSLNVSAIPIQSKSWIARITCGIALVTFHYESPYTGREQIRPEPICTPPEAVGSDHWLSPWPFPCFPPFLCVYSI
uniref:Secreted protein n=1 Tax=Steinernema glaseri TaxID=37863 RepID=A0A1I7ZPL2_9BILA